MATSLRVVSDVEWHASVVATWPARLAAQVNAAANRAEPIMTSVVRGKAISRDAVATGNYIRTLDGLGASHFGARATANRLFVSFGVESNDPGAPFVAGGRGPGGYPPMDPIREWMQARSIDVSAIYQIRRAIATKGTVQRLGYDGFHIFEESDDALVALAHQFVMRAMDAAIS